MAILPSQVPSGLLTGNYQFVDEDALDADTDPELIVVSGTVTFTASVQTLTMPAAKTVLVPLVFDCIFDNQGNLKPKQGNGIGIKLPATDSDEFTQQGWTWRVDFNLRVVATGHTVNLPSWSFQVPAGSEQDMAEIMPVGSSPGVLTVQGPAGKSAYEVAVVEGFVGTEAEWLASLQGPNTIPTDTAIATNIQTPGTETSAALNATIGASGAPQTADGKQYVWLAGVIRNDGSGWQLLPEATNHRPIGITSIETIDDANGYGGYIRVNYPAAVGGAGMTVAFLATPDETLAINGFTCGTSVTQTYTDIRIGQSLRSAQDYVYYDGTKWVSYRGVFTDITFTNGLLTLNHRALQGQGEAALTITPRHPSYQYTVSEAASSLSTGKVVIAVREEVSEYADAVSYNGTAWTSQQGTYSAAWDATGSFLRLTHPTLIAEDLLCLSLTGRGTRDARISATTNPNTATYTDVQFYDNGVLVTAPPSGTSVYMRKGRGFGSRPATAPTTAMKFYISHGGGQRTVKPSELNTIDYPSSNLWLYGVMGKA